MLRFDYDAVVAWHPYRTYQPWEHGGVRVLHVDGVNASPERQDGIRKDLFELEARLLWECREAGITQARADNHYGFTVRVDGFSVLAGMSVRDEEEDVYYQLRFSDGSLYVWLMPGPPAG